MSITRDAAYYDHQHDLRKHEPRPGDRGFSAPGNEPPERLHPPISEALEVAILIKCASTSLPQAAELIYLFARNLAAQQRLDAIAAGARP